MACCQSSYVCCASCTCSHDNHINNARAGITTGQLFFERCFCTFHALSTIYFKLAEITNGNELKNSKYGRKTGKK